jgi:hypothetical protein
MQLDGAVSVSDKESVDMAYHLLRCCLSPLPSSRPQMTATHTCHLPYSVVFSLPLIAWLCCLCVHCVYAHCVCIVETAERVFTWDPRLP